MLLCRAHRHRWWLRASAESRAVALPRSSPMEQSGGTVEMKGEVEFRRDTKSKLKAISSTEWMYKKGALKRGKQVLYELCVCLCVRVVI